MKKSSFAAFVLGAVSAALFAVGMCMAMLKEWNAFVPGIIVGSAGILLGIITVFVWRKMAGKKPIKLSAKVVLLVMIGIIGALGLGGGMCLCMVFDRMLLGIVIGLIGIAVLLSLVPAVKGIK